MESCIALVANLNTGIQTVFGIVLVHSAWKSVVAGLLASICERLVVRQTWADNWR